MVLMVKMTQYLELVELLDIAWDVFKNLYRNIYRLYEKNRDSQPGNGIASGLPNDVDICL